MNVELLSGGNVSLPDYPVDLLKRVEARDPTSVSPSSSTIHSRRIPASCPSARRRLGSMVQASQADCRGQRLALGGSAAREPRRGGSGMGGLLPLRLSEEPISSPGLSGTPRFLPLRAPSSPAQAQPLPSKQRVGGSSPTRRARRFAPQASAGIGSSRPARSHADAQVPEAAPPTARLPMRLPARRPRGGMA